MGDQILPRGFGSIVAAVPDRQTNRALNQMERRAMVLEAAADRAMRTKALLNETAKCHVVVAVVNSRQMKEIAPEAGQLLDAFDAAFAMDLLSAVRRIS